MVHNKYWDQNNKQRFVPTEIKFIFRKFEDYIVVLALGQFLLARRLATKT